MSFWRGERILADGEGLIVPFSDSQIDCNAYILRMGDRYFRTSDGSANAEKFETKQLLKSGDSFIIPSGQFAYLLTRETVTVPANAMAFISMRTQLKFQGLINVSGFHVDPGYTGKLLYAVFNAGPSPVPISEGDLLFKVWFCDLDTDPPAVVPMTSFKKKTSEGVFDIDNKLIHGMTPPILSLQSLAEAQRITDGALTALRAESIRRFDAQQPTIDNLTMVWRNLMTALLVGVIGTILSLLVAFGVPTAYRAGKDVSCYIWKDCPVVAPPRAKVVPRQPAPVSGHAGAPDKTP